MCSKKTTNQKMKFKLVRKNVNVPPVYIEANNTEQLFRLIYKKYGINDWINLYCKDKIIGSAYVIFNDALGWVLPLDNLPPTLQKFFDAPEYWRYLQISYWNIETDAYLEVC